MFQVRELRVFGLEAFPAAGRAAVCARVRREPREQLALISGFVFAQRMRLPATGAALALQRRAHGVAQVNPLQVSNSTTLGHSICWNNIITGHATL